LPARLAARFHGPRRLAAAPARACILDCAPARGAMKTIARVCRIALGAMGLIALACSSGWAGSWYQHHAPCPGGTPSPNFDEVDWMPLGCGNVEPPTPEHAGPIDLVGDAEHPGFYLASDDDYLYLRLRVDGNPAGTGGFVPFAWKVLLQTGSGDPFTLQYELV